MSDQPRGGMYFPKPDPEVKAWCKMQDLIERLEKAKEGSRELDVEIAIRFHPKGDIIRLFHEQGLFKQSDSRIPHYTTSIDAALTLVKPDWIWNIQSDGFCFIDTGEEIIEGHRDTTAALALCIAALKARESSNG